jgi:ribosomal protein S6
MAENTMPATEASTDAYTDEVSSYEFAFHILPTVAEGEVPETLSQVKAHFTNVGAAIFDEELPERIDLVYPIVKHLEGKNRRFNSAYFGWIRFRVAGEKIQVLQDELKTETNVLRFLIVKLTKLDEANPFKFHEHRKSLKMVEVINEEETAAPVVLTEAEADVPVVEEALNESLDKITGEGENSGTTEEKAA